MQQFYFIKKRLNKLFAGNNHIEVLQVSFLFTMPTLEQLNVNDNKIEKLPNPSTLSSEEIADIEKYGLHVRPSRLRKLRLDFNSFNSLPATWFEATKVKQEKNASTQEQEENQIASSTIVTENLLWFPTLRYLNLEGNLCLQTPPSFIATKGLNAVKKFFSLIREPSEIRPSVRCMFLGCNGVGKSVLIQCLKSGKKWEDKISTFYTATEEHTGHLKGRANKYERSQSAPSIGGNGYADFGSAASLRFGVRVTKYTPQDFIDEKSGQQITLNLWRLPGEQTVDAHDVFLTSTCAVFFIVFNVASIQTTGRGFSEDEEERSVNRCVIRWIKRVQARVTRAQITLVANGGKVSGLSDEEVAEVCSKVKARVYQLEQRIDQRLWHEMTIVDNDSHYDDFPLTDISSSDTKTDEMKYTVSDDNQTSATNPAIIRRSQLEASLYNRAKWQEYSVISVSPRETGGLDCLKIQLLETAKSALEKSPPPVIPRAWSIVASLVEELSGPMSAPSSSGVRSNSSSPSARSRLFVTTEELEHLYMKRVSAMGSLFHDQNMVDGNFLWECEIDGGQDSKRNLRVRQIVHESVTYLHAVSKVEYFPKLGAVMLKQEWSSELIGCILDRDHITNVLSSETCDRNPDARRDGNSSESPDASAAAALLSTGILEHKWLPKLLAPVLDQLTSIDESKTNNSDSRKHMDQGDMSDENRRDEKLAFLYYILRHFRVVIPLKQDTGELGGVNHGLIDPSHRSLVPSLLGRLDKAPWTWPTPRTCTERNRSIHFVWEPPGIMSTLFAEATESGFDINCSKLFRDAAVMKFRTSYVHRFIWHLQSQRQQMNNQPFSSINSRGAERTGHDEPVAKVMLWLRGSRLEIFSRVENASTEEHEDLCDRALICMLTCALRVLHGYMGNPGKKFACCPNCSAGRGNTVELAHNNSLDVIEMPEPIWESDQILRCSKAWQNKDETSSYPCPKCGFAMTDMLRFLALGEGTGDMYSRNRSSRGGHSKISRLHQHLDFLSHQREERHKIAAAYENQQRQAQHQYELERLKLAQEREQTRRLQVSSDFIFIFYLSSHRALSYSIANSMVSGCHLIFAYF